MAFSLDAVFELLVDGEWIPVPTYNRDTIEVETGRGERAARTDPGRLKITINNRDGRFSPRNPESDLYERTGRNSRGRLSVPGTVAYLQLDGNAANTASTPDHASLDITGDLDLRWEGEADWYAPGAQMLIGKWGDAGNRSYHLRLEDGSLYLQVTRDGTSGPFSFRPLPGLPRHAAVRGVLDADNGAGGFTMRLYWATTVAGPWTQLAGDSTLPDPVTIHTSTAPLVIAPEQLVVSSNIPRHPVAGRVHRAEVRNGIDGTLVAAPDFTAQAAGTTAFVDSAARTWTLSGTAVIRDRTDLIVVEVPEWPQYWTSDEADAWVPIEGAGILRRLGQGKKALQSTLRRRIPSFSPLAYWPMEEGDRATQCASPIDRVRPMPVSGLRMAAETSLAGSDALPTVQGSATLSGDVPTPVGSATQWHTEFLFFLQAGPATSRTVLNWYSNGTVQRWRLMVDTGGAQIRGYDADDTEIITRLVAVPQIFNTWTRWKVYAVQNGGTVDYTIQWTIVGESSTQVSGSYAGRVGRITRVTGGPYSADLDGMAIGHISVLPVAGSLAYNDADHGFDGESAWTRMRRLATEENLPLARLPGPETTEQVGGQRTQTLLTLLQAAADADGGLLLEDKTRPGLLYRERSSLYSQMPALTLAYKAAPGLAAPLKPVDDDTATRNDRTVKRDGGSEARAELLEGRLSVQDPPDGIGQYDDSVTLSLHDDAQTEPIAYWRLHLGTVDAPRYPTVRVLLHKAPHLIDQAVAVSEGDLIRITGLPKFVGFGDVDLIVNGIRHDMSLERWEVTFTCSPGDPWHVGAINGSTSSPGRIDANPGGSLLAAAVDADDTILIVHTPAAGAAPWPVPFITSLDRLTANPDFETDLAGWTVTGGTIERVPTPGPAPFSGDWSLLLTPDGVTATVRATSPAAPVTPGTAYTVHGWLRCAVARSVSLNVNWYDSGGAFISTSPTSQAVEANKWTRFTATVTAVVGAASARVLPTLGSTPPSTDLLHADVVFLGSASPPPGAYARDFPYDISVGGEVVRATANTPGVLDTFGRTVAGGWGSTDTGQPWSTVGNAADFSVGSGYGAVAQPTVGIAHLTLTPAPSADVDLYVDVATSVLASGASLFAGPIVRAVSNADWYGARLDFTTSAGIALTVRKRVANVESQLASFTTTLTHTAGTFYRVRFQAAGSTLRAKVWAAGAAEPGQWQIEVTDTALTAAASVGTRSFANTGSTAVNPSMRFDTFHIVTPQRMTVIRSVNGVTKDHQAGAEVRVHQPGVIAL